MQTIGPSADDHIVQFYDHDHVLCESVVRFLQAGVDRGEPVIVIATAQHREAFARGLDLEPDARVLMIDARETLDAFMVEGRPDAELFERAVSGALERLCEGAAGRPVCAYGEMVDILCQEGKTEAALELEHLWNLLAARRGIALLCAYAIDSFDGPGDPTFLRVRAAHARVHAAADAHRRTDAEIFRTIVDSVQDYAIFMLDVDGVVRTWNRGAERIKGYAAEEIVGEHFSRFYPPEDVAVGKCQTLLRRAELEGRAEDLGWRVRKDGTRFWASVIITALRKEDGRLVGFAKVTRDLTQQREVAEQRLARAAAERSLSLLERLHDVAGALGAARTPADVAQIIVTQGTLAFGAATGVLVRPIADEQLEIVAASGISDEAIERWRRFPIAKNTPISESYRTRSPLWETSPEKAAERFDGVTHGALACLPLLVGDRIVGVVAFRFEGERLFAPEERAMLETMATQTAQALDRAEATARAESANKTKDEFLAVLSHELRTPLTSIFGWASILRANRDPKAIAQGIETIHRNAQAQIKLIEELLDVSRIVSGKLTIDPSELDIVTLVREAADVVGPSARAKNITLEIDVPSDALVVHGDRARLQQVVLNLLSNAVKFTDAGGKVTLRAVTRDARVHIEVTDTGRGIASDFLPHVFERFRQSEEAVSRQTGGLGLGLSIAKHIVELHRGTIEAKSEGLGRGSSFVIALPLENAPVAAGDDDDDDFIIRSGRTPLAGMKIVVVEDEADARDMLVAYLGASGADVSAAANAEDGLRAVTTTQPHVLVSDIGMPFEDGYSLIRRLRGTGSSVPAIALTAYNRPEDRRAALEAGFDLHVSKPADPDMLVVTVAKLARR
ncbi:MAG TPA: ATP-binding protein [Polyangiaceae bacterium]|jgi:PAS domain S-box-containing protein